MNENENVNYEIQGKEVTTIMTVKESITQLIAVHQAEISEMTKLIGEKKEEIKKLEKALKSL